MASSGPTVPPAIHAHALPIEGIPRGEKLFRIHLSIKGAKYFGRSANWRFDDPTSTYGTLYAGLRPHVAFAEALLRSPGGLVAISELATRSMCSFTALRQVNLVPLHGRHLAALGATASVTSGDYAIAQQWSRALHDHPAQPDGIKFRATHDNDEFAVALFERAAASIDDGFSTPLLADPVLLGEILNHYRAGLR
jgi:hypothetical protein